MKKCADCGDVLTALDFGHLCLECNALRTTTRVATEDLTPPILRRVAQRPDLRDPANDEPVGD
jgi:hypothetical protein